MNQWQKSAEHNAGNRASAGAYAWAQKTFSALPSKWAHVPPQESGFFAQIIELPGHLKLAISSDGIGTKAEIAERLGVFDTLGYDLLAMVADDIVAVGARPLFISNIIDTNQVDHSVIESLMKGLAYACMGAGVAISGGEIAALGHRVHGYTPPPPSAKETDSVSSPSQTFINWSATGIGVFGPHAVPLASENRRVQSGHAIVALQELGLRSNGFTLARHILHNHLGPQWHTLKGPESGQTWGELLLTPSTVYTRWVSDWLEDFPHISGIVHLTGGGLPGNVTRVLRSGGLGACFFDLFDPPAWVLKLQEWGQVSDLDAYLTWNMGQGMLVCLPAHEASRLIERAFEGGCAAKLCGTVNDTGEIKLESRAFHKESIGFSVHTPLGKGVLPKP